MTNVLMHESRRLVLPLETMVDALLEFDHVNKRWPAGATLEGARVDQSSGIVLLVKQSGQDASTERSYSLAIIAAAIINYCAKVRVPIPRKASKSVAITASGITMTLEGTLFLQRQHSALPDGYAANTQSAQEPSSATPEPAPEPAAAMQPEVVADAVAKDGQEAGQDTQ